MDQFALITNKLMNDIEKISVSKQELYQKPLENTLKTNRKIWVKQSYGENSIYGEINTIQVPKEFNNLAQLYIKVTLSTGLAAVTIREAGEFAARIFSRITLRNKSQTEIQHITPEYTLKRIFEISGTPLYTKITSGISVDDVDFTLGDVVVYVPLFFFFSENYINFLPNRELEQLELEFITNESAASMGMSINLTSINYELFALYYDNKKMTNNNVDNDLYNKFKLPKYLVNSYNIFEENTVSVPANTSSARLLLRCPYPIFSLNISIFDPLTLARTQINSMKLTVGNNTFIDLDFRMNYTMSGDNIASTESGTFSYFFSVLKSRMVDSGLITFSKEFFPCYLDVEFTASDTTTKTMVTYEEIKTLFPIKENGEIGINESVALGEGFDQTNSFQGPFNLLGSG